jgi:hypothetical protein
MSEKRFPDPDEIRGRLEEMFAKGKKKTIEETPPEDVQEPDKKQLWDDEVERLMKCKDLLETETKFKVGDVVCWKPGLRNFNSPAYGRPAVVIEVLKEPHVIKDVPPPSNHFLEMLNLKILVLDSDRDCNEFLVDGRRFQKATSPE